MGFSEREIGHMSLDKFNRLYKAYKDDFDTEMIMRENKIKYSDLGKETTINDVIPF